MCSWAKVDKTCVFSSPSWMLGRMSFSYSWVFQIWVHYDAKKNMAKHGKRKTIGMCSFWHVPPKKRKGTPKKKNRRTPQALRNRRSFPWTEYQRNQPARTLGHSRPHIHESILFVVQKSGKLTSWGNGSLSQPLQGFIHPKWLFGISSINSFFVENFKISTSKCNFRFLDGLKPPTIWKTSCGRG